MRARRLVAAASVAALAVSSLAGCGRSAPDVAAYVGETTYPLSRVDAIYEDAQSTFEEVVRQEAVRAGGTPSPEQLRADVTRQDVVNLLVSLELGRRIVAAKNIQVPDQISPEQLQQQLRVPAAAEYTRLWGEWADMSQVLSQQLPAGELSDDAVMAVYRALQQPAGLEPGMSVEQVRQLFGDGGFVRAGAALSVALQEEAERASTSINPRYQPIGVPSVVSNGQALIFYSLPYIDTDGPVTDISTPEPLPSVEPTGADATEPVAG
ncbi:hypothetical protein QTQ03_24005 [Micromonospora sp. WMMA1363]|uniref:hypothetical protein n=1 Tax=Micromonospora sp. WMMA1363 TaxID=3053985 RepID=UPI00259CEA18|nr:hypothetical protein [Micromonospora sp. WMMA1363]MDM4722504.1 hypothetical protein [Micromonospora sp. WMMA1363]